MTAKTKPDAKAITSDQLEEMFDNGDDILDYVDMSNPVVEHHPRWRSASRSRCPHGWSANWTRRPPIWRSAATPSSTHGSPTACAPRDAAKRSTPSP
ncbi:MAG: hypothetical protein ACLR5C_02890 [Bifidobacterium adolescentis]